MKLFATIGTFGTTKPSVILDLQNNEKKSTDYKAVNALKLNRDGLLCLDNDGKATIISGGEG